MTISVKCFEKLTKERKIQGFWNTDGSVSISMRTMDKKFDGYVKMTPAVLREIVLKAFRRKRNGVFHNGKFLCPDLFGAYPETLIAEKTPDGILLVQPHVRKDGSKFQYEVCLAPEELKAILNDGIAVKDNYDKECGIRPIIGYVIRKDNTRNVK